MPKPILYFIYCILLIGIGVIIANLWLSSPFNFELLVQIFSVIGSICTVIALCIAIQALNEWKKTYAYTKADSMFEKLQADYWVLSGAFGDAYNKELDLLNVRVEDRGSNEQDDKVKLAKDCKNEAYEIFSSEIVKFKKTFIQLQPYLHSLDGNEKNYLECIDAEWLKVIYEIDCDSGHFDYLNYTARTEQKRKADLMLKDVRDEHWNLLNKIRKEIQGKLKF